MTNLSIERILDVSVIQELQEAFSEYSGLASIITDSGGRQVTEPIGFSEFCRKYMRSSADGVKKCMECSLKLAYESNKMDQPFISKCHAGLVCFSMPIMLEDKLIGCFCSGQVISTESDEKELFERFDKMGIDAETSARFIKGIRRVSCQELLKAANFVKKIVNVLSATAYKNFVLTRKQELDDEEPETDIILSEYINQLKHPGAEKVYNTRELFGDIAEEAKNRCRNRNVNFELDIDSSLPQKLFGSPSMLKEGILSAFGCLMEFSGSCDITFKVSMKQVNYSTYMFIDLIANGSELPGDVLFEINHRIYSRNYSDDIGANEEVLRGAFLTDILINKLSGSISLVNIENTGIAAHITLPQLNDKETNNAEK